MSIAIFIRELVRNMPNLSNDLQVKAIICNTSDYKMNHQIIGQFLTGILIKYFTLKKKSLSFFPLMRTKRQKGAETISEHFYWCSWYSSADSVSAKEKHEIPFPSHQGSVKNCSIKNTFTVCSFPAGGGHVHFIPILTQPHWKVAGLLVCPNSSVWIQKEKGKKRCERKF